MLAPSSVFDRTLGASRTARRDHPRRCCSTSASSAPYTGDARRGYVVNKCCLPPTVQVLPERCPGRSGTLSGCFRNRVRVPGTLSGCSPECCPGALGTVSECDRKTQCRWMYSRVAAKYPLPQGLHREGQAVQLR